MITPSFSLTATERVLPRLALDFTTASLDSRVTLTRALNTSTRINSSGYIETVNADLPRFDFNPTTLVCRGLLIEESRINTHYYSEDVASWSFLVNLNTGSETLTNPKGSATSRYIQDTAATSTFRAGVNLSFVTATTYTFSVYLRQRTSSLVQLWFDRSSGRVNFDLSNGTITASDSGAVGRIEPSVNGWYRCSITQTTVATGTGSAYVQIINSSTAARSSTYTGTGANSIYVDCAQLEVGAFPTSYIPNTASSGSVTRNADAATMTGTNFSSWYNATEGTFAARGTRFATGLVTNILGVSDGTTTNRIRLYQETNNRMTINTSVLGSTTTGNGTATYGVAAAYSSNGVGVSCNGGTVAVSAAGAVPTGISSMDIGRNSPAATVTLNGWLQSIYYWPQRLTNAELQAFSK